MNYFLNLLAPTLIGGVIGFVSALLVEPAKRFLYHPNLRLDFHDGGKDDEFRPRTPEPGNEKQEAYEAYFVRVKVINKNSTTARGCVAHLIRVEKRNDSTGNFEPTVPKYCDSLPVAWSYRGVEPIDLPMGVAQYVDIISTNAKIQDAFQPETKVVGNETGRPLRYGKLWGQKGTFRFTIQVSGENFNPKRKSIVFVWKGIWDDFEAKSA